MALTNANLNVPLTSLYDSSGNQANVALQADTVTQDPDTGVYYAAALVSLLTKIAGEDIANDRLKVSSETVISNTNTQNAVSILNGSAGTITNANFSSNIDCSNYRNFAMAGWGATGNIQLLLQVSYDGGTTWLWSDYGFTAANQFALQRGTITAPLCRVAATNVSGSTQNVTAYLCLQR